MEEHRELEQITYHEFEENVRQNRGPQIGLRSMAVARAEFEVLKHIKEGKDPCLSLGMYFNDWWWINCKKLCKYMYVYHFSDLQTTELDFFSRNEASLGGGCDKTQEGTNYTRLHGVACRLRENEEQLSKTELRYSAKFISEIMKNTGLQQLLLQDIRTRAEFIMILQSLFVENPFNPDFVMLKYPEQSLEQLDEHLCNWELLNVRKDYFRIISAIIDRYHKEMISHNNL